jgi:tripartite-type tricarboxylate transporter receptor subunit TctC
MMKAGQARALAVTSSKRAAAAPELPTIAEAGVPNFDVSPWSGLLLPAKTAPAIIDKINHDVVAVLAEPGIKQKLEQLGVTPVSSTPQEFAKYLKAEMDKWGPVIRDAKITIDD